MLYLLCCWGAALQVTGQSCKHLLVWLPQLTFVQFWLSHMSVSRRYGGSTLLPSPPTTLDAWIGRFRTSKVLGMLPLRIVLIVSLCQAVLSKMQCVLGCVLSCLLQEAECLVECSTTCMLCCHMALLQCSIYRSCQPMHARQRRMIDTSCLYGVSTEWWLVLVLYRFGPLGLHPSGSDVSHHSLWFLMCGWLTCCPRSDAQATCNPACATRPRNKRSAESRIAIALGHALQQPWLSL